MVCCSFLKLRVWQHGPAIPNINQDSDYPVPSKKLLFPAALLERQSSFDVNFVRWVAAA